MNDRFASTDLRKSKKRNMGVTVLILSLLLFVTGTFAWQSMQQFGFNPMWRIEGNIGGRIHDRFEITTESMRDLSVFAENFGEEDLFVRIRLREFFAQNGAEYGIGNSERDKPLTWPLYLSTEEHAGLRRDDTYAYEIGDIGVEWRIGQTIPHVFMPTFNHAIYPANSVHPAVPALFAHLDAHRMTEATGNAVDWFSNPENPRHQLPEQGDIFHASDFDYFGNQTGPGLDATLHRVLDNGRHDNWSVGDVWHSNRIYTQVLSGPNAQVELRMDETEYTHVAQYNLMPTIEGDLVPNEIIANFTGVITIRQWMAWGRPTGNFWIHDTTNDEGWFYWNGYLLAGEGEQVNATSLLLSAVDLTGIRGDWEYVVMSDGEFFTADTIEDLSPPVSEDAEWIFRPDEESESDDTFYDVDGEGMTPEKDPEVDDSFPVSVTPEQVAACSQTMDEDGFGTDSPAFWQDPETGMHWCVADTDGDYVMLVSRFALSFGVPGAPIGAGTASENIPKFGLENAGIYLNGDIEDGLNRNHSENLFQVWGAPNEYSVNPITNATTAHPNGPEIRGRVNQWFEDNRFVSEALRNQTVHANIPLHSTYWESRGFMDREEMSNLPKFIETTHVSTPVVGGIPGEGLPFFLGPADLNVRFGPTEEDRIAVLPQFLPVVGDLRGYWLRSGGVRYHPGLDLEMWGVERIEEVGFVMSSHADWVTIPPNSTVEFNVGFRPAIWVRR